MLGKAARERALELFTIGRAVDTFDKIYRDVAASHPSESEAGDASGAASGKTASDDAELADDVSDDAISQWTTEESSVPTGLAA